MSVKLTDTQLVMLSAGGQREDLCLTAPDKMKGAILTKVSEKLVRLGLVREVRAKAGTPVWRRDDVGQSYALKLTATGLKAIAVDDRSDEAIAPREALQPRPNPDTRSASGPGAIGELARTPMPRAGSKLATVIDLLQRSEGATLTNLIEATGWLSHTTRAALTGLRKRGYAVVRKRVDAGDSVYRIADPATDRENRVVVEPKAARNRGRQPKPKASRNGLIGVARKPATSEQGTKQPAETAPEASHPLDASMFSIVAGLEGQDFNGLRRQWRAHLGGEPPTHLPRWLLVRVLAYRLQVDAFGGLDRPLQRTLRSVREGGSAVPFDRRAPQTRDGVGLRAGALLVREWNGNLERVMILEEGFAWNGQTFRSLSQIAKAMTVPPEPDGLVADVDPALGREILDIALPRPRLRDRQRARDSRACR